MKCHPGITYRRVAQDLGELLRQQATMRKATQELARSLLTRSTSDLDGEQRAAMRSVASRQLDLSRRTERSLDNLRRVGDKIEGSDPDADQMLSATLDVATDMAVVGRMRQAGKLVGESRMGAAIEQQGEAHAGIEEMLDQLSRRDYSAEERERRLQDSGRDLQRLQSRQRQLTDDFDSVSQELDAAKRRRELQRLVARQQAQSEAMQKIQRQLKRLRAQQAAETMQQAKSSSQETRLAAESGNASQAAQQSKLSEDQMEEAERQLRKQIDKTNSQLVAEQMTKLPQRVEAIAARQQSIADEIKRLQELRTGNGKWTSGMQASLTMTVEEERNLSQDAVRLSESINRLPAYAFAVQESAIAMNDVADWLEKANTTESTQASAVAIVKELKTMLATMKDDPSHHGSNQSSSGNSGSNGQNGGDGEDFEPSLAQLKC